MKNSRLLLLAFFIFQVTISQNDFNLPQITRPSPTVAQLMKFEEVQLNHYTGQPNIAIPLFNKNIHGLNYNLTLQYQVSGIRVDEQSGWVGKGWALNAGGVISRNVVGLPDDIDMRFNSDGYYGINHNGFYDLWELDGSFYNPDNTVNLNNYDQNENIIVGSDAYKIREFYYNALWAKQYKTDYQRDIFQFNFFGHVGRFIFEKEGINLVPKIIGNDSKLKINTTYSETEGGMYYPTVIDYFTITDENGFIYTFDEEEETTKTDISIVVPQSGSGLVAPNQTNIPIPKFRSAWKLTKVENSSGSILVSFDYGSHPIIEKPKTPNSYKENVVLYQQGLFTGVDDCDREQMISALEPRHVQFLNNLTIESKKLKRIIFRDNIVIDFFNSYNHPEYDGVQLNRIEIKSLDFGFFKKYSFVYNDHMRLGVEDDDSIHNHKLLFLDSIKVNNSSIHKYVFQYGEDTIENLRAFGKTQSDQFGYYHSNDTETYKHLVNSGALSSITYPTGGKRQFNWESNTYSFKGNRLLSLDEVLKNPDNYSPVINSQTHITTNNQGTIINQSESQLMNVSDSYPTNINYQIIRGAEHINNYNFGVFYVPVLDSYLDETEDYEPYIDIMRTRGSFQFNLNNPLDSNREVSLEPGKYVFYIAQNSFMLPDNDENGQEGHNGADTSTLSPEVEVRLTVTTKQLNQAPLNWFVYGGGLRIKSIEDIDNSQTEIKTNFNYALEIEKRDRPNPPEYPGVHNFSSGSFDGEASSLRKYEYSKRPIWLASQRVMNPIRYKATEYLNALDAQLTQGNFIGYKHVAEFKSTTIETDSNDNPDLNMVDDPAFPINNQSAIKYVFDSARDHPTFPENYQYPYIPFQEKDYLRGNLRKKTLYNSNNQKIKEVLNTYNFDSTTTIEQVQAKKLNFVINEGELANKTSPLNVVFFVAGNGSMPTGEDLNFGTIQDAALCHSFVIRESYRNFNDFFNNDSNNYRSSPCSGETLPSGTIEGFLEGYYVPKEEFTRAVMEPLTFNLRMLTDEVSYKVLLTSSEVTDYYYEDENDTDGNAVVTNTTYTYDPGNYQIKEQDTYYAIKGEEEHLKTKYFYPTSNGGYPTVGLQSINKINELLALESYKNGERISTVQNIHRVFDNRTPDSSDDIVLLEKVLSGKGYEIFQEGPYTITDYNLEDRIIYHDYDNLGNPLEVSKADGTHISYVWGYNQSYPVAKIENATRQQIESLNGFGDDFHSGTGGLTSSQIETLKIQLTNSMVTTYTYKPLVGVTSITDPRGDTVSYEYDEFNRLKYIKDKDGNILSKNKYNYANQN